MRRPSQRSRARRARRPGRRRSRNCARTRTRPSGNWSFDGKEDDAADGRCRVGRARETGTGERDAATVRALELAVARAEAATAGRAEAEAALAGSRLVRSMCNARRRAREADVERLTGERDAATAARAAAEERLQAASPSKKDHAARALEGIGTARRPLGA